MDWKMILTFICGIMMACAVVAAAAWWRRGRKARAGRRGERAVAKELARLRKKDFVVLNDLLLPLPGGRTSQIDHVVVSSKGIFVIETKNMAGRISGSEHAQYWQQHFASNSRTFYNPLLQNKTHLRTLRRLLPDVPGELFHSMIVFTSAWRLDIKADDLIRTRRLLPDLHIRRTFIPEERRPARWWRPGRETVLDEHQTVMRLDALGSELKRRTRVIDRDCLRRIADKILSANIADRESRREHTDYARRTSRNISDEISRGICPRCGATLTIRKGERGEFAGCSRYPACRFTCSIDRLHG